MRESAQTDEFVYRTMKRPRGLRPRDAAAHSANYFLMAQDPYIPAGAGGLSVPLADRSQLSIFPRLSTYSQIVAKLQWDPNAIDLAPDAKAWPGALRRAPPTPDHAARRLPRRRGLGRRAPHAVRRPRRARRHDDDVDLLPPAPRRGPSRPVLRPRRRRGSGPAGRYPGRPAAPRRGSTSRPRSSNSSRSACPRWPPRSRQGAPASWTASGCTTWCSREPCSPPGSARCSTTWTTTPSPGYARAWSTWSCDERWHVGFGVRCLTEAKDPEVLLDDVLSRATEAAGRVGGRGAHRHAGLRRGPVPPAAGDRRPRRRADRGPVGQ